MAIIAGFEYMERVAGVIIVTSVPMISGDLANALNSGQWKCRKLAASKRLYLPHAEVGLVFIIRHATVAYF